MAPRSNNLTKSFMIKKILERNNRQRRMFDCFVMALSRWRQLIQACFLIVSLIASQTKKECTRSFIRFRQKIETNNLCIGFGTWEARRLIWSHATVVLLDWTGRAIVKPIDLDRPKCFHVLNQIKRRAYHVLNSCIRFGTWQARRLIQALMLKPFDVQETEILCLSYNSYYALSIIGRKMINTMSIKLDVGRFW